MEKRTGLKLQVAGKQMLEIMAGILKTPKIKGRKDNEARPPATEAQTNNPQLTAR
ncbi:hypothetical protein AOQ84DRAFT_23294 [Glonium stellatum]|uniref:Uncharacterized protein n=1 Tax=Glonium stellatum TaxID=574774 RepID=A0A8E2JTX9_9PEZI|nr:hypothetical protein AOQ84DRAFT_23294 [Glonium stellatum]